MSQLIAKQLEMSDPRRGQNAARRYPPGTEWGCGLRIDSSTGSRGHKFKRATWAAREFKPFGPYSLRRSGWASIPSQSGSACI